MLHAMLSIVWMKKYHTLPPLSIYSMLPLLEDNVYEQSVYMISHMYKDKSTCSEDETRRLNDCCIDIKNTIKTFFDTNIEDWNLEYDFSIFDGNREVVDEMIQIVDFAIHNPVVENHSGNCRI